MLGKCCRLCLDEVLLQLILIICHCLFLHIYRMCPGSGSGFVFLHMDPDPTFIVQIWIHKTALNYGLSFCFGSERGKINLNTDPDGHQIRIQYGWTSRPFLNHFKWKKPVLWTWIRMDPEFLLGSGIIPAKYERADK